MVNIHCCECAIEFGIPEFFQKTRREDHRSFWCPNGHVQSYRGESDAERYKRLMEAAQANVNTLRERALAAERTKERVAKQLKNLKKRTAAGVCPCCSRTVSQLANHMQSKHKEYLELQGLRAPKQLTAVSSGGSNGAVEVHKDCGS